MLIMAAAATRLPASDLAVTARRHPPLARWDAGWFLRVADGGYDDEAFNGQSNVVFYPMYPVLVRIVSRALGTPLPWTGIGISLLCLLGALAKISAEVQERWGSDAVRPFVLALLAFPTAFFFASFYSESLFLLLTVSAMRAARRERWWVAAGFAAAGALTRMNGVLIIIPLAAYGVRKWLRTRQPRDAARPAIGVVCAAAGAGVFPLFLWRRFGDPMLYLKVEHHGWRRHLTAPWETVCNAVVAFFRNTSSPGDSLLAFFELACLLGFAALTVALWRGGDLPEALYAAANLLVILSSGTLASLPRYVLVLYPCFIPFALKLRRRPIFAAAYVVAGAAAMAFFLSNFVRCIWVA